MAKLQRKRLVDMKKKILYTILGLLIGFKIVAADAYNIVTVTITNAAQTNGCWITVNNQTRYSWTSTSQTNYLIADNIGQTTTNILRSYAEYPHSGVSVSVLNDHQLVFQGFNLTFALDSNLGYFTSNSVSSPQTFSFQLPFSNYQNDAQRYYAANELLRSFDYQTNAIKNIIVSNLNVLGNITNWALSGLTSRALGTNELKAGANINIVRSNNVFIIDSYASGGSKDFLGDQFFTNANNQIALKTNLNLTNIVASNITISSIPNSAVVFSTNNFLQGSTNFAWLDLSRKLSLSGNIDLPNTSTNQWGVIYKNGVPFIHNFNYGSNTNSITTTGHNLFIGENAGNLTMGANATANYHASYNTGLGYLTLNANMTGYYNTGIGSSSLSKNTTGYNNTGIGSGSLYDNTTGSFNTGIGIGSLYGNTTGSFTTGIGANSLYGNTTGSFNTGIGANSLFGNTTGLYNIGIGLNSGRFICDGSTTLINVNNSTYIGAQTKAYTNNVINENVFGYNATGNGSYTFTFGDNTITQHVFTRGIIALGTNQSTVIPQSDPVGKSYIYSSTNGQIMYRYPDAGYARNLYLHNMRGTPQDISDYATNQWQVISGIDFPTPGTWLILVHGYAVPNSSDEWIQIGIADDDSNFFTFNEIRAYQNPFSIVLTVDVADWQTTDYFKFQVRYATIYYPIYVFAHIEKVRLY